ncbi:MAG: hypothetical protein QXV17_07635, partial [Candidatus Micrarchaeaceae archaeon]
EGFRENWYKDSLGNETIGYGFTKPFLQAQNITIKNTIEEKEAFKIVFDWVEHNLHEFIYHSKSVIIALLDMLYNLGNQLYSFDTFFEYLKDKNYTMASYDLTQTLWTRQVKTRAIKDIVNISIHSNIYYVL